MVKEKKNLVIQIVDDSYAYRYILKKYLTQKVGKENIIFMEDSLASSSIEHFTKNKPDCVLLDYRLPDDDGFSVLKKIKEIDEKVPVIVLTSEGSETIATKFLLEGADNYFPKNKLGANELFSLIFETLTKMMNKRQKSLEESDSLGILSHEIKTPLNTIVSAAGLMEHLDSEFDRQQCIEAITSSAKHLLKISSNIQNFYKINKENFYLNLLPGNLEDHIKQLVSYLGFNLKSSKVTFDYSIKGDFPPYIMADFFFLKQVLINLINNAVKYTPKGYIHFNVNLVEKNNDFVRVLFKVADTGIGIPVSQIESIFDKYTQVCPEVARGEGIGLGLAICKTLVEAMDGEIKVVSEAGKGTEFSFELKFAVINGFSPDSGLN